MIKVKLLILISDEFATPCSTPDEMDGISSYDSKYDLGRSSSIPENTSPGPTQISDALLHQQLYDKYVQCFNCFLFSS